MNHSLSGVWYEIFWCLLVFFVWPEGKPWLMALVVGLATGVVEVLQLWHPPFLDYLRRSFIGATILGTSFAGSDFAYYVVGCGIGWLWMRKLQGRGPCGQPASGSQA